MSVQAQKNMPSCLVFLKTFFNDVILIPHLNNYRNIFQVVNLRLLLMYTLIVFGRFNKILHVVKLNLLKILHSQKVNHFFLIVVIRAKTNGDL